MSCRLGGRFGGRVRVHRPSGRQVGCRGAAGSSRAPGASRAGGGSRERARAGGQMHPTPGNQGLVGQNPSRVADHEGPGRRPGHSGALDADRPLATAELVKKTPVPHAAAQLQFKAVLIRLTMRTKRSEVRERGRSSRGRAHAAQHREHAQQYSSTNFVSPLSAQCEARRPRACRCCQRLSETSRPNVLQHVCSSRHSCSLCSLVLYNDTTSPARVKGRWRPAPWSARKSP